MLDWGVGVNPRGGLYLGTARAFLITGGSQFPQGVSHHSHDDADDHDHDDADEALIMITLDIIVVIMVYYGNTNIKVHSAH